MDRTPARDNNVEIAALPGAIKSSLEALLCAPVGKDTEILLRMAEQEHISASPCSDLVEVARRLCDETLFVILAEEALRPGSVPALRERLEQQSPWSDVPIIVLASGGDAVSPLTANFAAALGRSGNIAILERPTRIPTLRSVLRVASNARQRQFQLRDMLDREKQSVSELRQATETLKRSEEAARLLASIVDSSADAIASKDLNGVITSWNHGAENLFGYSSDEAVGKSITLIIPKERWNEEPHILSRIRRGESVDHFETVRLHKNGSLLDISLTISPIRDKFGEIVGASKVARNISDRKRAEEALRNSESRLKELADSLERDVQARTTELEQRNNEVLKKSEELRDLSVRLMAAQDQERRHIARELHDSAGQAIAALGMTLSRLAKNVQTQAPGLVSDTEESQQMLQQLSHDIRTTSYLLHPPLLDEAGLTTAIEIYAKGLTERGGPVITVEIPKEIGRLPSDLELVIFRVIQESLTNVVRHSESKTASIRLEVDSEQLKVKIQDTGKGIAPERMDQIHAQVTGVGIRGMRERIRQFGGQMNISSSAEGTTVTLRVPLPKGQEQ